MLRPGYLHRLGDATSQWLNVALLNGDANESISGRSWREGWLSAAALIDNVLGDDHCEEAYLTDIARALHLARTTPEPDLSRAREVAK